MSVITAGCILLVKLFKALLGAEAVVCVTELNELLCILHINLLTLTLDIGAVLTAYIGAFIFEEIRLPQSGTEWGAELSLAIICSCVGFTIQPFGQKYTTPERAGILAVFNPLTAAVLGVIFLHEKMTPTMLAGSFLILVAILLPAWIQDRAARKDQTRKSSGPAS